MSCADAFERAKSERLALAQAVQASVQHQADQGALNAATIAARSAQAGLPSRP